MEPESAPASPGSGTPVTVPEQEPISGSDSIPEPCQISSKRWKFVISSYSWRRSFNVLQISSCEGHL
ncbi:hypothetical protein QYF36_027170 [Acer negundo]|nr:hypothetical protein QYF36_027170 [Acer negundo]